jgi:molecular chaperone GrpE
MEEKEILNEELEQPIQEENATVTEENATEPVSAENGLESQLAELKDKFLRLFAEFDNYKKRMAREKLEYMAMAGKDVIIDMISVKDDFERALKSFENTEDLSAVKEGITLIYDKLNKTIERKGVKKIDAIGQPFNVEIHEAITEIPVTEEAQKGTVIDEVESGYTMYEKVIRFAKVVVGK